MNKMLKKSFLESKILSFLSTLNKRLILYFYGSFTYKTFLKMNGFFKNRILQNTNESFFIRLLRGVRKRCNASDAGLLIILVLVFNTLIMFKSGRQIDIFSIVARVFFLSFGVFLILHEHVFRKKN